jgi:GNAT superfamily N-acetyltransferase
MADCRIVRASRKDDFLRALAFVLPHEKNCCALVRKILDREEGVYLVVRGGGRGHDVVEGVFFFCEGDILLPCLSGIRGCGLRALSAFLEGKELFCISALESDICRIRALLARLSRPPRLLEGRRYLFLEHQDREAARRALDSLPEEFHIQVAGKDDEAALLPLHLSYMKEEVLIRGRELNAAFERGQLKEALESQVVVMAVEEREEGVRVAAKAGTNAIASGVMQLGGVYTVEDERGRGLAAALTAFLAESAAQKGMATVLFVDRENAAAIAAYRRAGFRDSGRDYAIDYYE